MITISTEPVTSLGVTGTTIITSSSLAQSNSVANAASGDTFPKAGVIAGGVIGGIAIGIVIVFFVFRWWKARNQQKRGLVGPDRQPIPLYTDEIPRPVYFAAAPSYPSKRSGAPSQVIIPTMTDRRPVLSTLVDTPLLIPASTAPGQTPTYGHIELA